MPIEIRELIIKTEVRSEMPAPSKPSERELDALRAKLLRECKRLMSGSTKNNTYKR